MNAVAKNLLSATATVWKQIKDSTGFGGEATYLWPRWLVLRGVGLVYIVVFAGIITESAALIGPDGITPLSQAIAQLRLVHGNFIDAFLANPSLFWISSHPVMAVILQWVGLLSAIAVVLNLWPRLSLFVCWLAFLSFARSWILFSGPMVDKLMLEASLLCIPFAPSGYRPGLGAHSSPRPFVLFTVRWLIFRVMFENGITKLLGQDLYWFNLTAMDVLYETAPSPTILGYLDHQLPHLWHVGEIFLTFAAEIAAPLLAVFCGRRGRWIALGLWSALQIGIQLTCNFGWLNTLAFALGLLLLDDQMLTTAAQKLRLPKIAAWLKTTTANHAIPTLGRWRRYGLNTALSIHFYLSLTAFATLAALPTNAVIDAVSRPLNYLFHGFGSANAYSLYSRLEPFHFVAEFLGSNDGGATWRSYDFRYFPQQLDRISPFSSPWFHRFEANLQVDATVSDKATPLYSFVAARLLEQKQPVIDLFEKNPFPENPPQLIRVAGYSYNFTSWSEFRATGNYWKRSYLGEYMSMNYLNSQGQVRQVASELEQLNALGFYGNIQAQTRLGLMYLTGEEGVARNPSTAHKWLLLAAQQGDAAAQLNLSLMLATGDGIPSDSTQAAHWCRLAAEQGLAAAQDRLGLMLMQGEGLPRNPIEGLAWFDVAARSGFAPAEQHRALAKTYMSSADIFRAEQRAQIIRQEIARQSGK